MAHAVAQRLASASSEPWDPAILFYVRERIVGLLAWYVISNSEGNVHEPFGYRERVSAVLAAHFPSYPPDTFPSAALWLPPQEITPPTCAPEQDLLLILPGVARILSRQEFAVQMAALRTRFPCLAVERVNTLSFVSPSRNARRVREAVERHPNVARIHMLGYSQGGLNALAALVESPEIGARTRTVMFLDVPAHGSEVGEALYQAIRPAGWFDWLWPGDTLRLPVETAARALGGLSLEELESWLREEGETNLGQLLRDRIEGVRSLGTTYADEFWAGDGKCVPRTPLYAGFRAIVTKRGNLPLSNLPLYALTNDLKPRNPYNDMQVRLASQQLGGTLAAYEVLGPVAEGNHWQWALVPGDVPDVVMPPEMTRNMPHSELLLAYYSTFAEIGLLGSAK